ncbi:MAG: TRAP transporter substrate-binding protein DctP [Rhizobiales bacterium]|nr:TRAP transporter substrate-binding protein DctP [Hyphomicrobiales bacterium]
MHKMKFIAAAGLISALMGSAVYAQESVQLRMLTAWNDRFDPTAATANAFMECTEEASSGRFSYIVSGPEVIPASQQFDPISRGIFDVSFITPIYFLGTTGVPSAFFALEPNSEMWRERGYWNFADEEMARFNQKLVALTSGTGASDFYQLILREPVAEGDQPLEGLKIRGNNYYEPLVVPLGGSLVNLPGGEIYSALEKGVVDGAAYPIAGMQRAKMHEVADYMLRPRFGNSPFVMAMNLDRFNALDEADQKIVLDCGHQVEISSVETLVRLSNETIDELTALGMRETTLPADVSDQINARLIAGSWQTAIDGNAQSASRVEELREMARANGDAD